MRYINKHPEYRNAISAAENEEYTLPPWAANKDRTAPLSTHRLDLPATAQQAIDIYLSSAQPSGLISGVGWWQNANGYTAIALKDLWLGQDDDKTNTSNLATLLRTCAENNPNKKREESFINVFNDDCCWWALCSLYVYALTKDPWFLTQAKKVWQQVRKSQLQPGQAFYKDEDMHGAVFWTSKPGETSINAISTGLFAELSVRLALLKDEEEELHHPTVETTGTYLTHTRTALSWILRTRYNASSGVIYDNINLSTQMPDDRTFTYNAGVTLGTAALLSQLTGASELLTLAMHIAFKAMTNAQWVESNGVLTEPSTYKRGENDPLKNTDGVGFKAVLMRQLGTLYHVIVTMKSPSNRARKVAAMIHSFLWINLHAQLEGNTDGGGRYGPWWNGPFEFPTNHSQMAVLDVLAVSMLVNFSNWSS